MSSAGGDAEADVGSVNTTGCGINALSGKAATVNEKGETIIILHVSSNIPCSTTMVKVRLSAYYKAHPIWQDALPLRMRMIRPSQNAPLFRKCSSPPKMPCAQNQDQRNRSDGACRKNRQTLGLSQNEGKVFGKGNFLRGG
jgi:hypothetical protein